MPDDLENKEKEAAMKFKAVFFDRDNTLTYYNPKKIKWQK
jgi:hypothetical protein